MRTPARPALSAYLTREFRRRLPAQKEILAYHYPDELPLGSFELLASNKIRSDEETLGEVFNGDSYYCEKAPPEDPEFTWVPRKEQVRAHRSHGVSAPALRRLPWRWPPGI